MKADMILSGIHHCKWRRTWLRLEIHEAEFRPFLIITIILHCNLRKAISLMELLDILRLGDRAATRLSQILDLLTFELVRVTPGLLSLFMVYAMPTSNFKYSVRNLIFWIATISDFPVFIFSPMMKHNRSSACDTLSQWTNVNNVISNWLVHFFSGPISSLKTEGIDVSPKGKTRNLYFLSPSWNQMNFWSWVRMGMWG